MPASRGLIPGVWYAAMGNPGIYVSILQPNFIAHEILQRRDSAANKLDSVEASALCYLIAFDLDQFELGYARGTEHPDVDWSDHILERMKDPALPGPDGIGSIAPLIATGLVSPSDAGRTVATFTGGFKRTHGAFKQGQLGLKNHGSHYGFVENGVVFSKLQPGLATIVVLDDGSVEMKTWEAADNRLLSRIKHARQNGVPLVEFDRGVPVAGAGPPGWPVGRRELVRFRGCETADDPRGRGHPESRREALPDLCRVLHRHAVRDGARLSGLRLPVRDAARHERARAHLPGGLSTGRLAPGHRSPYRRHERPRQVVCRRASRCRASSDTRTTGISST